MLKKRIAILFFALAFTVCLFSSIAASAEDENEISESEAETIIVEATQLSTDEDSDFETNTDFVTDPSTNPATDPVFQTEASDVVYPADADATTTSHLISDNRDVVLNIAAVDAEYNPIEGVEFEIYRINEDFTIDKSDIDIKSIDKSKLMLMRLPATGADGKTSITLSTDKRGVYIVSCVSAPEIVKEKPSDFLVSLPYTSEDGSQWLYELDASPKFVMNIETEPETATAITSGTGSGIDTNGNGNDINTNGSKGNIKTGEIATGVCLAAAVVLFSAGVLLVAKAKEKSRKIKRDR